MAVEAGDEVIFRETEERVRVLAVLDASGTLLLQPREGEPFQAERDEVERPWAKHAGCGCCS